MKSIILLSLCLASISLNAQTTLTGIWNTGNENTRVEITEINGTFIGTLVSSDNEDARIGRQLLKDVKADGEGWKGKLYAPRQGEWYDATLTMDGERLLITVGSGFRSKTVKWRKE